MKKIFAFIIIAFAFAFGQAQQSFAMDFDDVEANDRFVENMQYLFDRGVIQGFEGNKFQPYGAVTRGNASIMIARALELDTSNTNTGFPDVGRSSKAAGAIQAVKSRGIVTGFSDGNFYPNREVTRAEMAILIARAFEMEEVGYPTFWDISSEMQSFESIRKVLAYGVAEGYTNGQFRPNEVLTRAHFSAFLSRAMNEEFRLKTTKPGSEKVTIKEAYAIGSQVTNDFAKSVRKLGEENGWGYNNSGTVEISKPVLEKYISKSFIDNELKSFIETYYCDCDLVNLPKVQEDMVRFTLLDVAEDAFTVKLIEFPLMDSISLYHLVHFKAEGNKWKIDSWEYQQIRDDLKLTKQEVEIGMKTFFIKPKVIGEYYSKKAVGLVYIVEDLADPGHKMGVGKADGSFYIDLPK